MDTGSTCSLFFGQIKALLKERTKAQQVGVTELVLQLLHSEEVLCVSIRRHSKQSIDQTGLGLAKSHCLANAQACVGLVCTKKSLDDSTLLIFPTLHFLAERLLGCCDMWVVELQACVGGHS